MPKSGILHIGLPKTATTSFQNALYANRHRILADYGIFYPSIEANHTNALCTMFLDDPRTHIALRVQGVTDLRAAEQIRSEFFEKLERDIESVDWDTLVLSAEGLSNLPAPALVRAREWLEKYTDDWTVLFWSRHPVTWSKSVIQQLLKNGKTFTEVIDKPQLPNFQGKLTNAFKAFGRESVHLTAFEDAVSEPGGVVAAFCRCLGLEEGVSMDIAKTAKHENESMSMYGAYLLESMNRQRPYFVDGKISSSRRNGEVPFILRIKGAKFDIPDAIKKNICVLARHDVKWLNDTFGTSYYMDVFDENNDESDGNETMANESLDTVALLVSDLINLIKR